MNHFFRRILFMRYVTVNNDTAIIKVVGEYNLLATNIISGEIQECFSRQGCSKVCVDFSETDFIESSAIRDLSVLFSRVGKENFRVVNVRGDVYTALSACKLDELWDCQPEM